MNLILDFYVGANIHNSYANQMDLKDKYWAQNNIKKIYWLHHGRQITNT